MSRPAPRAPTAALSSALPDGQGYVEILEQTAPIQGKKSQSRVVAYFLDSSRKPLASTPTAFSLNVPSAGTALIELKPTGDADPAKAGGLATSPIPDRDGLSGDLSATIDGKAVTVPIDVR